MSTAQGAITGDGAPPIIAVRDVVKTFGALRALDGVDLAVPPGIVYGLLGPNGAGKTTLIRILATLLRPTSGRVEVAGVDVVANATAARTRIGLAGQFAAVDGYQTGRENIEMVGRLYGLSPRQARRRTEEVLDGVDLGEAADRLVRTYSGGMRRRLDLAASLVGRPPVLYLDEPTTGIDPTNRMELWGLVEELVASGTTVLLTTQHLEEADRLAARIGVIDQGQLIVEGTANELKDTLGGSVLELATAEEHETTALQVLARVAGDEPAYDAERARLRVRAPDGSQTLIAAIRALDAAGIAPTDVVLQRPSLDDVFLSLTGHPTGQAPPAAAEAHPGSAPRGRPGQPAGAGHTPGAPAARPASEGQRR
jgi:daunorubicin resistance ABC transporter ATP-binding subunit